MPHFSATLRQASASCGGRMPASTPSKPASLNRLSSSSVGLLTMRALWSFVLNAGSRSPGAAGSGAQAEAKPGGKSG